MNVKLDAKEINRAAKVLAGIINPRDTMFSCIQISGEPDGVSFYATNRILSAKMKIPMIGVDEEAFCIDGTMFTRIVQGATKDVEIVTDGKDCTIKAIGKTRIPIIDREMPKMDAAEGNEFSLNADGLRGAVGKVYHAVSADESRIVLTGIKLESYVGGISLVALDGFQMAMEKLALPCPENIKMVIPGVQLKKVCDSLNLGEDVLISSNGSHVTFRTDGAEMTVTLLHGEYPDVARLLPTSFKTSVRVCADELKTVIKAGQIASEKNNLIRLEIYENELIIRTQSQSADFEAHVDCETQGEGMKIGFNQIYLLEAINSIDTEFVTMNFNSATSPEVTKPDAGEGIRLTLPVRVMG